MRPRRAVAICAALAIGLAGCTVGPSPATPLVTADIPGAIPSSQSSLGPGGPGQPAAALTFGSCERNDFESFPTELGRSDCALLPVPLDYLHPPGVDELHLRVVRLMPHSATSPTGLRPLLVLRSHLTVTSPDQLAEMVSSLSDQVRRTHVIYQMDYRGTAADPISLDPRLTKHGGYLACLEPKTLRQILSTGVFPDQSATDRSDFDAVARSVALDCNADQDGLLTNFDLTSVADDIDTLRASIGVPALSILGRGFGGTAAAVYAHRYPTRVSAMVLDAPDDPLADRALVQTDRARAAEAALDNAAAMCAADREGCPKDLRASLKKLLADRHIVGTHRDLGRIGPSGVLLAIAATLPDQIRWFDIAVSVAQAEHGKTAGLLLLIGRIMQISRGQSIIDAPLAFTCNSSAARPRADNLHAAMVTARKSADIFGPLFVGMLAWCGSWPTPARPVTEIAPGGLPPVVVIVGESDPVVPGSASRSLASRLPSAVTIAWHGIGHGGFPTSKCVSAAVNSYLLNGTVPEQGTLCGA